MTQAPSHRTFADLPQCPACHNPMLDTSENKCPLCGFALDADEVIGDDATPYARQQDFGYRRMVYWILTAGSYRLGYLSRMKRSAASARFCGVNLLLIALSCALIHLPTAGWRRISDTDGMKALQRVPSEPGWVKIGEASANHTNQPVGVQVLWWNPVITVVVLITNLIVVYLLEMLTMWWTRVGCNRALSRTYRGQDRFGAAIHYGTAHAPLMLLAGVWYAAGVFQPLAQAGRWPIQWPLALHVLPAFLIASSALFMMWFWYVRLGSASPADSTARVNRYFILWAPMKGILLIGGWLVAEHYALDHLTAGLGLNFS